MEPTQPTPETPVSPQYEPGHIDPSVSYSRPVLSTPVAIIIAGIIIAVAVIFAGRIHTTGTTQNGAAAPAVAVNAKNVDTTGLPFIGQANAPAMIYFSDFQCPYCKAFETTILPTLKTEYVDTGKLKIVFKDFVFLGPDSQTAALFGQAVWHLYPQQYFAWREAMFAAQDGEDTGFGDRPSIEKLTATIPGIDQAKVSADVDANTAAYTKTIADEANETQTLGITGTPSIIVGTQLIGGFNPLSTYEEDINTALGK